MHDDQVEFIPVMQGWLNILKSISMIDHINKMRNKNHMVISIDAKKTFDRIQHPLMINILNKVDIEDAYLNIINKYMISPQLTLHSMVKS